MVGRVRQRRFWFRYFILPGQAGYVNHQATPIAGRANNCSDNRNPVIFTAQPQPQWSARMNSSNALHVSNIWWRSPAAAWSVSHSASCLSRFLKVGFDVSDEDAAQCPHTDFSPVVSAKIAGAVPPPSSLACSGLFEDSVGENFLVAVRAAWPGEVRGREAKPQAF